MSVHPANSYIGLQYYGNSSPSKMEVHHAPSKKANCQLDEIKDGVRFIPTRWKRHTGTDTTTALGA
jgi:hypothetical protein